MDVINDTDDFTIDSLDTLSTELFPDFCEHNWHSDDLVDRERGSPFLRRSSECMSETNVSCDSDGSSGEIDVVKPDYQLAVESTEADEELVQYMTDKYNMNNAPPKSPDQKNNVRIVRILKTAEGNDFTVKTPPERMLKLDSAGNPRMSQRIHVVRPALQNVIRHGNVTISRSKQQPAINDTISSYVMNDKSSSRSAIAARENREKKKKYISDLEKSVGKLKEENLTIKEQNVKYCDAVSGLEQEVAYLKSVLANQSTLSKLLQNIPGIPDISLSSSEMNFDQNANKKRMRESSEEYSPEKKTRRSESTTANKKIISGSPSDQIGGVCLHVSGSAVSLEFCSSCNQKSKTSTI